MRVLIIDNFDSFTFNLYQMCGKMLGRCCHDFVLDVKRNNQITIEQIAQARYDRIIISPGPGEPGEEKYFGVCAQVLLTIGKTTPVLGVCLGMQGMVHYHGGKIIRRLEPMHGKTSIISHNGQGVFAGLPQNLEVMRYHSLIVDPNVVPDCFIVTARAVSDNNIMGLRHKQYPIEGVQFHPESFATEGGKQMMNNFLFVQYESTLK